MFIHKQKINLIPQFFLEILHFKESCSLTGQEHFGFLLQNKNFVRYEVGSETSKIFILHCFWESQITCSKNVKYPILGPFLPKFGQKGIFPQKLGSVTF